MHGSGNRHEAVAGDAFTGTGGRTTKWTLQEIITRLGVKKVGAIAQQVKMINMVKPQESEFDLKRFWEHSAGTAIIADKLVTDRLVRLEKPLEFSDYWIGALLHDVGKLVLGFSSGTGCPASSSTAPRRGAPSARRRSIWVTSPVTSAWDS